MGYKLDLGGWNSVFAVPASLVDNYLRIAGGNSVKVLLYFLRHSGQILGTEEVARKIGISPSDVLDSLEFWRQAGILTTGENPEVLLPSQRVLKEDNNLTEIDVNKDKEDKIPLVESQNSSLAIKKVQLTREHQFNPKEIAVTIRGSDGVEFLFKRCEELFGRPLKHIEQNTLMIIVEEAGVPVECALMLAEYCFSIGKSTPQYMKKLALSWVEKDIKTISDAEDEIRRLKTYYTVENELKRLFEMKSAFSKIQKDFIEKWTRDFGFDVEVIDAAYQATLNNAGSLSFPYMNKILAGWKEKGYKTLSDTLKDKKPSKKDGKNQTNNSSFDINEFYDGQFKKYNQE